MLLGKDEIIAEIEAQMMKTGGTYEDWCIGVAKDPRASLFEAHVVEDRHDGWLYREDFTAASAREVKDHFVVECGLAEDPESGLPREAVLTSGDNRQDDVRRVLAVVIDRLLGDHRFLAAGAPIPDIEVTIEAREIAAGDGEAKPVAFQKDVGGGPQVY